MSLVKLSKNKTKKPECKNKIIREEVVLTIVGGR